MIVKDEIILDFLCIKEEYSYSIFWPFYAIREIFLLAFYYFIAALNLVDHRRLHISVFFK